MTVLHTDPIFLGHTQDDQTYCGYACVQSVVAFLDPRARQQGNGPLLSQETLAQERGQPNPPGIGMLPDECAARLVEYTHLTWTVVVMDSLADLLGLAEASLEPPDPKPILTVRGIADHWIVLHRIQIEDAYSVYAYMDPLPVRPGKVHAYGDDCDGLTPAGVTHQYKRLSPILRLADMADDYFQVKNLPAGSPYNGKFVAVAVLPDTHALEAATARVKKRLQQFEPVAEIRELPLVERFVVGVAVQRLQELAAGCQLAGLASLLKDAQVHGWKLIRSLADDAGPYVLVAVVSKTGKGLAVIGIFEPSEQAQVLGFKVTADQALLDQLTTPGDLVWVPNDAKGSMFDDRAMPFAVISQTADGAFELRRVWDDATISVKGLAIP